MQIICKACLGKAVIYSRDELDVSVAKLYCSCKNPFCGHTFAMDLTFSHTLSPSMQMAKDNVINLLKQFPKEQLELIKAAL